MKNYFSILELAFEKGKEALEKCIPTPQHFYPADLIGKPLGKGTIEPEGDCGGAYIDYLAGNSEIVRFFKKNGEKFGYSDSYTLPDGTGIRKGVYKGYTLHAPTNKFYNGQSHERYTAFYKAYAEVLKSEGISCGVKNYLT